MMFDPFTIKGVTFRNRVLRSSVGGRMSNYDGVVTPVWKNFEKKFAAGGIGGLISTTLNVNRFRKSPLEYPPISEDRYVEPLRRSIKEIKATGARYLIQLGDPGYATQTSLFSEVEDSHSSSKGMDLIYGYRNRHAPMSEALIEHAIEEFGAAAVRARDAGADGIEVTASKGYLIHQFLNPGINRRKDGWGGSRENRFKFCEEVVKKVRARVGSDYLFGIRLAAEDYNHLPVNIRLPLLSYFVGNRLKDTLYYARRLKELDVDFLHIDSGYGFIHPRVTPGPFPFEEVRLFFDSTRHLSAKAAFRASICHVLPAIGRRLFGLGWKYKEGINLDYARRFKQEIGLPVVANGGFQYRTAIDDALTSGGCDMVSMARALLANPDLVERFKAGEEGPQVPCTHCNRCAARTATSPLGCYDPSRFPSARAMEQQIMDWNRGDDA